jgi:hypothetical protein
VGWRSSGSFSQGKRFFLEKKKQKTIDLKGVEVRSRAVSGVANP